MLLSVGIIGTGGLIAVRRISVSTISLTGVDFVGRGIVAIAVLVVYIDHGDTLAMHGSDGGELLATCEGFLVRGAVS